MAVHSRGGGCEVKQKKDDRVKTGNGMDSHREWAMARDRLIKVITELGFEKELGEQIAAQLGSLKAIRRMTVYLENVRPQTTELVVDEMLAICSEIEEWRRKKEAQETNARYNEMLYYGIDS